jgi:hypothetical protein
MAFTIKSTNYYFNVEICAKTHVVMAEKKTSNKSSNSVRIAYCSNCEPHEFQDQRYGYKQRVHNNAPVKGNKPDNFRCTVCRTERTIAK